MHAVAKARLSSDCLVKFRQSVFDQSLLESNELDSIDDQVMTLIEESVQDSMTAPRGVAADVTTDVYINY